MAEAENFGPIRGSVTVQLGQDRGVDSEKSRAISESLHVLFRLLKALKCAAMKNEILRGKWSNRLGQTRCNYLVNVVHCDEINKTQFY